nr:MAG TPA: DNA adenine methylase [Caudoviricetes sp.]
MKTYKKAPLPFIGQKRNFLKHFIPLLQQNIPDDGAGWTIVDVFGGSGLLAHTAKRTLPKARVVYNDFDGYAEWLHHIADTERLRQRCIAIIGTVCKEQRLNHETKARLIAAIEAFDGFTDVQTLASWFLFSGKQAKDWTDLKSKIWWNGIAKSPYAEAADYLDGLEIRQQCFTKLLPEFAGQPKTLLLLDPPYVSTAQGAYANEQYFGMVQFLKLADNIKPPFVFFSSTKSELSAYVDYVCSTKTGNWQAWEGCRKVAVKARLNYQTVYEDNMLWTFG